MTALRSAAVQYSYKTDAMAVAQLSTAEFKGVEDPVLFLSGDGSQAIVHAGHITQISDTKTGAVYRQMPMDSIVLYPDDLDKYVTLDFSLVNNRDYYNGIVFRG